MARPSTNTDLKLLEAGRKLLPETGIAGLSVRRVAEEAGVNLGMFHYHFKTKDEFARRLLGEVYEEFFQPLRAAFENEMGARHPLERLGEILLRLGRFILDNRAFVATILRDAMAGEPLVLEFAAKNAPRHVGLLYAAIADGQAKGALRSDLAPEQAMIYAISAVAAPNVLLTAMARAKPEPLGPIVDGLLNAPGALEMRVDLVLRGLKA